MTSALRAAAPTAHWLAVMLLVLAAGPAQAEVGVPDPAGHVTDLTGTLTAAQRSALDEQLAAFEQRKGAQVVILLVPTTQPEAIEQYALRVAERWRLGRAGVDDGALLLVAKDDRTLRIEVGYGLEGVLTDATARRIIDEIIVPRFRTGDFYGGITAGVTRVLAVIDGEPLPEPARGPRDGNFDGLVELLPVAFIFTITFGTVLKRLFGQLPGALATGAAAGAVAWVLSGGIGVVLLAAVAAFVLTLLARTGPGRWASRRGGGWGGGMGAGGGGGFRGGGGGFGGGGASGRW